MIKGWYPTWFAREAVSSVHLYAAQSTWTYSFENGPFVNHTFEKVFVLFNDQFLNDLHGHPLGRSLAVNQVHSTICAYRERADCWSNQPRANLRSCSSAARVLIIRVPFPMVLMIEKSE
eukprot:Plantae.Rhodophyta-Purpureofilum_apyrenoidigerum.ctg13872.p1 GENE.Plantae.Rhodophyta-Purpureofilum_apyrenoidigerum.ctg13872~~Plantae.Rhodophyta-Purpureofilum_apyrenoidigerum.ctg13872.p1  ORF type:complete len:119 (-),score=2.35 Plantae.Rhodophyta-Purpureofilum_apyrenoidigerum.ctg13872:341-697(-)